MDRNTERTARLPIWLAARGEHKATKRGGYLHFYDLVGPTRCLTFHYRYTLLTTTMQSANNLPTDASLMRSDASLPLRCESQVVGSRMYNQRGCSEVGLDLRISTTFRWPSGSKLLAGRPALVSPSSR